MTWVCLLSIADIICSHESISIDKGDNELKDDNSGPLESYRIGNFAIDLDNK